MGQKKDEILRKRTQEYVEYKRSAPTKSLLLKKDTRELAVFDGDEYMVFLYKKTERLTTALYMITNLFTESEPLKWTLR